MDWFVDDVDLLGLIYEAAMATEQLFLEQDIQLELQLPDHAPLIAFP